MSVCVCVCASGCRLRQSSCSRVSAYLGGAKVSDSVAFHSSAGGTACAHVSLPICVKYEISSKPQYVRKASDVK